jgi:hypothetical protein
MCESVKMTNWGRVFYTNLMSAPFLLIILFSASEQEKLSSMNWNMQVCSQQPDMLISILKRTGQSSAARAQVVLLHGNKQAWRQSTDGRVI